MRMDSSLSTFEEMNDKRTNGKGHILTLQPLYFDFKCKHGVHLAMTVMSVSREAMVTSKNK